VTFVNRVRSIARWILRRDHEERRLHAELESFIDMAADDYERAGMARGEARRRARMDLGGIEQARERVRTERHGGGLDALGRDVRYAARTLVRQPGFALVVVVTLAAGIGANTAIFSLIDTLLLRTLPVERPQELVQIFQTIAGEEDESFSCAVVRAIDRAGGPFRGVAGFSSFGFEYGQPGALQGVRGAIVTGAFYETLGLHPAAGRLLDRTDDEPGARPVAVISDRFWQREFDRRPDAVGSALLLDGKSVTVVGVSPPGFTGARVGSIADITIAAAALPEISPAFAAVVEPGVTWMRVLARPAAGVAPAQAANRLNAAWRSLAPDAEATSWKAERRTAFENAQFRLGPGATGWSPLRHTYQQPLRLLMAAVALLLLIACSNVASLLLARASARTREVSVRLALGAARWRVIRQMMIESVLVSLAGAVAGVPLAWVVDRALVALIAGGGTELSIDLSPDWRVLAFTTVVAVASGVAFGLGPALRATNVDPARGLRDDGRTSTRRSRLLPALVTLQVALSFVLVAAAGLFVRTFDNLRHMDPGFDRAATLMVGLGTSANTAVDAERLADVIRSVPGVRAAGIGTNTPLDGSSWTVGVVRAGEPVPDDSDIRVVAIGPGYAEALGFRVVAGRAIEAGDRDGAPRVAIVNDLVAARLFPGATALGQRLSAKFGSEVVGLDIVGVVRGVNDDNLREPPHPTIYIAYDQMVVEMPLLLSPTLVVSATGPVSAVRTAVQTTIQAAQPQQVVNVTSMRERVSGTIVQDEMMATLAGAFGVLALGLAGLGLYGLLSYMVAQRAREIGIRRALGANSGGVVRLVVTHGVALVLGGAAVGVPAAWFVSRWIESMLFGLTPADPISAVATVGALLFVAAVATLPPALRAARVDPLVALRPE